MSEAYRVVNFCPLPKTERARTAQAWLKLWREGVNGIALGGLTHDRRGDIKLFMLGAVRTNGGRPRTVLGMMAIEDLVGNTAFLEIFPDGTADRDFLNDVIARYLQGEISRGVNTMPFDGVGIF